MTATRDRSIGMICRSTLDTSSTGVDSVEGVGRGGLGGGSFAGCVRGSVGHSSAAASFSTSFRFVLTPLFVLEGKGLCATPCLTCLRRRLRRRRTLSAASLWVELSLTICLIIAISFLIRGHSLEAASCEPSQFPHFRLVARHASAVCGSAHRGHTVVFVHTPLTCPIFMQLWH